jgi:hypothetical protein
MRILGLPIELWVFLGIGLLSFIQWLIKKAQAQQELKKARRLQQQREAEILRTGRDPVAERAAQLKAEQERLRRMEAQPPQEDSSQQPAGESQPQTIERELWPGGPVIVITQNGPTVRPSGSPSPTSTPSPVNQAPATNSPAGARVERERQRQLLRERKQAAQRQAAARAKQNQRTSETNFEDANRRRAEALTQQQARFVSEAAELAEEERSSQRRAAAKNAARAREESIASSSTPREVVFVKPTAAWQWRRAFVTAEVFNAPVTLRPNHFEDLGGSSGR